MRLLSLLLLLLLSTSVFAAEGDISTEALLNKVYSTLHGGDSLVIMDDSHTRLHDGFQYTVSTSSNDCDASSYICIWFAPSADCGMIVTPFSSGSAHLSILELEGDLANYASQDGTVSTPINRNRDSSSTADSTVKVDSKVNYSTTTLDSYYLGSTFVPGQLYETRQWIADADKAYAIRLESLAANLLTSLKLEFCEE